ncbi:MAG TPA: acyl-CoA dehydrogenase family protein [Nitrospiraceae bacterium]
MAENLIDAAKSLVPLIQSSLERIDSERQLPSDLASAMAKQHLFGLYVPTELGGPETDPITAFRVVEEIAQADGSVGWCVFNGTAVSSAVARLSPRAAKELFGDPPLVLGSGSARAGGTAKLTEGGYIVTGRWNFLSGIDHSIALFLACRVIDDNGPVRNDDGAPITRTVVVPVAAGEVLNTWTTLGMRGTASNDAEFVEVFVPADHTYTRGDPAHYDGPLYTPPESAIVLGWTLSAANTLGMARGAMNTFVDLATDSGSTDSAILLQDRRHIKVVVGECEAMIDSARRYVLDTVESMWEAQVKQKSELAERSMRARLAITHAIRQSIEVVDKLFNAAGTNAIHHSVGLERFFRDLHVHGQHISGLPLNFEFGGSVLLGVPPPTSLYT